MYLTATNKSSSTSNGIPANTSGVSSGGFAAQQDSDGNITQIKFVAADNNPVGTDTDVTSITAATLPSSGEMEFTRAFVNSDPNLYTRVELWRAGSGMVINRSNDVDPTYDSSLRRTRTQINSSLVDSEDVTIAANMGDAGAVFRLVDSDGTILTRPLTTVNGDNTTFVVKTDDEASLNDIRSYFISEEYYANSTDNSTDVVEPTGVYWILQPLTNQSQTDGTGRWVIYNENGKKIASN